MSEQKIRPKDYNRLITTIIEEATKADFQVKVLDTLVYGKTGYPALMLKSESRSAKYNAVLASGAHGDEPWAVDCLIQSLGDLDKTLWNFWIFPVTNPSGWQYQSRLNGNKAGINWRVGERETPELSLIFRNSPSKVTLFCDVHGDADKSVAYAYERKVPGGDSLARLALTSASSYFEIEKAKKVYGEPCKGGVVSSGKEGTLEEFFFEQKGAIYSITLEIPGRVLGTGVNRIAGGARLITSTLSNLEMASGVGTKPKKEEDRKILLDNGGSLSKVESHPEAQPNPTEGRAKR